MTGPHHRRALPWRRPSVSALLLYAALLIGLVAAAPHRIVGDGPEYVGLARAVAHIAPAGEANSSFSTSWHFWMYPAMAAPFVRVATFVGVPDAAGFTVLNVTLLLLAFWVVANQLGILGSVFLMAGPILWWADKAHTEVFTFSLLSIALAARDSAWAPVAVGLAATQNPPVIALLPLLAVDSWARRFRQSREPERAKSATGQINSRRLWFGFAGGAALALLPIVYYQATRGVFNPLLVTSQRETPTLRELLVVVCDPNLGLVFGYPVLPLMVLASAVLLVARLGLRGMGREAWVPAATAAWFLWTFAHVTNFNHGATPGMSRYAIWFIPLLIPLLRPLVTGPRFHADRRLRDGLVGLTVVSVLWSFAFFRPSLREGVGSPSGLARFIWSSFPSLDNPLPEIFIERNSGSETTSLPMAEPGCAKVLLLGDGAERGLWPLPCRPSPVPPECRRQGALCYGNRDGLGYHFVHVPPRAYHDFRLGNDTWPLESESLVAGLLAGVDWRESRVVRKGEPGVMVRAVHQARRSTALQGRDRVCVCVVQPHAGAAVDLRVPLPMTGQVFDLQSGTALSNVSLSGEGLETVPLPTSDGLVVLFAAAARR